MLAEKKKKDVNKMINRGFKSQRVGKKAWTRLILNKQYKQRPCISDMTLQVNQQQMPVIRQPNFTDKTWDVSIDKVAIVVGNEREGSKLTTITLKEYLGSFDKYMSKSTSDSLNLLVTNKSAKQKDTHVIMSSQACFLPIEKSNETKFNVCLYNYQSRASDPAVLAIVSTSKGTSAQIIEGTTHMNFVYVCTYIFSSFCSGLFKVRGKVFHFAFLCQ
ncbi:hypothetical protein RFI_30944 [Reticulomyxa filosa]|uniref:Uncharacterized protein n=1 Tax=Reticulomyxa filosa TaxID=46433 RepID=X6M0F5_RETFI|nr:hypothetical protein RFI_30944 [Reticulomyxa filosa]|eukprot:ETO06445.1 hypothetical protein RFI_30944 [Reticulomyxa filosa]